MKTKPTFANIRSSASAGSGKTYSLTGRYIAIALEEADPASIVALTFTRKSAGEFLSEILRRTASAAESELEAKKLSKEVSGDENKYSKKDFISLLGRLVKNLGRLRLGTIDSFCSAMLGSFASDFGIFSDLALMDSFSERRELSAVRERVFKNGAISKKTFEDFSELVKKTTFGQEEKSISKKLAELVELSRKWLWLHPDISEWGNPKIFKSVKPAEWNGEKYECDLKALRALEPKFGMEKLGMSKFFENSNHLRMADYVPAFVARLSEAFWLAGRIEDNAEIASGRKTVSIPPEMATVLTSLFAGLLSSHLHRLCEATHSLAEICSNFEKEYTKSVRAKGKLVFDDIPKILSAPDNCVTTLLLEERLDSKLKHWMFDEFQDTSRAQWKVFKNLVDEAVFDDSKERSFFYVGDVKQSIYSWRGGDFRLFGEIFANYSGMGLMEEGEELVKSWRSGLDIIVLVNALFSDSASLESVFKKNAAGVFSGLFTAHETAVPDRPSYVRLSITERAQGRKSEELAAEKLAVYERVYGIVKEVNPPLRGKSCAVLLRKNDEVEALVEYMRRRAAEDGLNIPAAGELDARISSENMIVPPFIQIVQRLAHPSDSAATAMLEMTPVWKFCRGFDSEFLSEARADIECGGYSALFKKFENFIKTSEESGIAELDEFSLEMLERLCEACGEFDKNLSGGDDAFVEFIRSKTFRSGTAENTVQVMTIHKSKGLGFDMVILPDAYKNEKSSSPGLGEICDGRFGDAEQYLGMLITPPAAVCALDPLLNSNYERVRDARAFEDICALYVAFTRAKNAVYVVMPEQSNKSASPLKEWIVGAFESINCRKISDSEFERGDPLWFEKGGGEIPQMPYIVPVENPKILSVGARPDIPSAPLVEADEKSLQRGALVHELLRLRADFGEGFAGTLEFKSAVSRYPDADIAEAVQTVERLAESEGGRKVFEKHGESECFSEYQFLFTGDSAAVSGIFDRLEVFKDIDGSAREVRVIDYKSTSVDAQKKYARQLSMYARAAKSLFNARIVRAFVLGYDDCNLVELEL